MQPQNVFRQIVCLFLFWTLAALVMIPLAPAPGRLLRGTR
jgi:hypothetical protein